MIKKSFLYLYILITSCCICFTSTIYAKSIMGYVSPSKDNLKPVKNKVKIPDIREKFAILISCDEFQAEQLPANPQILNYVKDLAHKLKTLNKNSFNQQTLKLISGNNATAKLINQEFTMGMLGSKALPDDFVFIYIAGLANLTNNDLYLYTFDSLYNHYDREDNKSLLSLKELLLKFKTKSSSKYIVLALDVYNHNAQELKPIMESLVNELKITGIIYRPKVLNNQNPNQADNKIAKVSETAKLSPTVKVNDKQINEVAVTEPASKSLTTTISLDNSDNSNQNFDCLANYLNHLFSINSENLTLNDLSQDENILFLTSSPEINKISFNCPTSYKAKNNAINYGFPLTDLYIRRPDIALISHTNNQEDSSNNSEVTDDLKNNNFDIYMTNMKKKIDSCWQPPKTLNSIRLTTGFTVLKDGKIEDVSIIQSSGDKEIDQSALQALQKASPLDKLPSNAPDFIQIRYKFKWDIH